MKPQRRLLFILICLCAYRWVGFALPRNGAALNNQLIMTRADYMDRVQAIWTAQMVGQWTGLRFEHQVASVLRSTPLQPQRGMGPSTAITYKKRELSWAFE